MPEWEARQRLSGDLCPQRAMSYRPTVALAVGLAATSGLIGSAWLLLTKPLDRVGAPSKSTPQDRLPPANHVCRDNADCPPFHACVVDRYDYVRCLKDECAEDAECAPGSVCRVVRGRSGERGPRLCVLVGTRKDGERCHDNPGPNAASEGCAVGLLCQIMFCGRPCRMDQPSSCGAGSKCREGLNGPSCMPSCEEHGCPEGKTCVPFLDDSVSVCAAISGVNCLEKPCPNGQECQYWVSRSSDVVPMGCATPCDDSAPCPGGFVCAFGYCERQCFPSLPDTCEPGTGCSETDRDRFLWSCRLSP